METPEVPDTIPEVWPTSGQPILDRIKTKVQLYCDAKRKLAILTTAAALATALPGLKSDIIQAPTVFGSFVAAWWLMQKRADAAYFAQKEIYEFRRYDLPQHSRFQDHKIDSFAENILSSALPIGGVVVVFGAQSYAETQNPLYAVTAMIAGGIAVASEVTDVAMSRSIERQFTFNDTVVHP
jgi:hypothetical protein